MDKSQLEKCDRPFAATAHMYKRLESCNISL